MHPLAFPAAADDPGFLQHFHMMGECRLGNMQLLKQLAGAFFPMRQHLYNPEPVSVGKRPAYLSCFGYFHTCFHIHDYLCVNSSADID